MPIGNYSISAAIITYNEQAKIADCLKSLAWADERVVVDSQSTDNTLKIAERLGARVIEQVFLGHVRQKQLALDHCTHDWVLCVDADERVTEELKQSIEDLFLSPCLDYHGYRIQRKTYHLGRWILHGGWFPDQRIRLVNRQFGAWGGVDPHDKILIQGKAGKLKGCLEHYAFKDLSHNVEVNNRYSSISAERLAEAGKNFSYWYLFLKPCSKWLETYILKRGFLDGLPGFIISIGAAYSIFLKYAKLWELTQLKPNTQKNGQRKSNQSPRNSNAKE